MRAFVTYMEKKGVKPPSIRKNMAPLKALFATAAEDGDIKANPTPGVRLPGTKAGQRRVKAMTREELALVLTALPPQWQPFFTFLGQTGLRISEALGLTWGDVELGPKPHVKVRRQRYKGKEKELKTHHSMRDVPLSQGMVATLAQLRAQRYRGEDSPVWCAERGGPLDAYNVRRRVLRPVVRDLGMPWVGFHTFRHTCASVLFAHGKDVKQVQTWLGHGDPGFTLRCYVHLLDEGVGDASLWDAEASAGHPRMTPSSLGLPRGSAYSSATEGRRERGLVPQTRRVTPKS
jgi:integrase